MRNKLESNPIRMYAVVPEEGFLEDTVATFKEEGEAEYFRATIAKGFGCSLVVVAVQVTIDLITEEDDG